MKWNTLKKLDLMMNFIDIEPPITKIKENSDKMESYYC